MKSLFITIAALVSTGIAANASEKSEISKDGVEYSLSGNTATVIGYNKDAIGKNVDIPAIIQDTEDKEYSVVEIESRAFFNCNEMTSISLPTTLTYIGEKAFYGCNSLLSLDLPSSITHMGNNAFEKCLSIESLTLSSSLTEIPEETFKDCYAISSVTIPSSIIKVGKGAFYSCYSMTALTIPSSVTEIGGWAFYGCNHLTTVTIPSSVKEIGESAFWNCTSLETVSISSSVTEIKEGTFYGCHSLASVAIPPAVTSIGERAFEQCMALPYVIIPPAVTKIGGNAFWNCESLATIVSLPTVPPAIESNTFYRLPENTIVYVPAGTLDVYPAADNWTEFHDFRELGTIEMTISASELNMNVDDTTTLTVTVEKAYDVTIISEEWSTSNPDVATVNEGVVTGTGEGTATISYTLIDGTGCPHVISCDVFVEGYAGIEDVAADDYDTPAEYYDLNGKRISSDSLERGIYIKIQGKKATKILVK